MKILISALAIIVLLSAIAPNVMACNITQPFKELPASYTDRWALGYHSYYSRPDRVYSEKVADDQAFNDGWNTAEKFTNIIPMLKQTPTSYTEGWIAGHNHKQVSGDIPAPPGHSPAWTHGFFGGYVASRDPKNTGYTDGWLAGRHAFLASVPNNINNTGHTQFYQDGFNAGYHANKDPFAGDMAFPLHAITYTDPCD
jgi:hypothetical protein